MPPLRVNPGRAGWMFGYLVTVALVAAATYGYLEIAHLPRARAREVASWRARLESLADDRREALGEWIDDAIRECEAIAALPVVGEICEGAAAHDRHELERAIALATAEAEGHEELLGLTVVGARLEAVLVVGRGLDLDVGTDWLRQVSTSGATQVDLRLDGGEPVVMAAAAVSQIDDGGPPGVVVLTIDPAKWLYPLLLREPTPTSTGEALLVARTGQEVAFLSPLRHSSAALLTVRRRLDLTSLPAALAAAGESGFGRRTDYRGVSVLAAYRSLDGTPWGLVVKVDEAEALADFRAYATEVRSFAAAVMIAFAAAGFALWRGQRATHYKALAEQESRVAELFAESPDAGLVVASGTITEANRAAGVLLGCPPAELVGQPLSRFLPASKAVADSSERDLAAWLASPGSDERRRIDRQFRRVDGSEFTADLAVAVLPGSDARLLVWLRDVTVERAERERLRLLVEGSPRFFFYTQELDGSLSYVSPSIETITGRSAADWRIRTDWFVTGNPINAAARERTLRHLRGELSEGPALVEVEHAEGHPVLLEVYEFGRFSGHRLVGLQGVAHDVTQRARAEVALRHSEERFRSLVEGLGEGVGIVDPDERVVFANPAAEAIFGVGPGELVGRDLAEFLTPESLVRVRSETARRSAGDSGSYEIVVVRPDASRRNVVVTATPQRGERGRFAGAFGIFRDVTERRTMEEQLRHAQKLEAVGLLAGGIAHDFNNLLQAMLSLTQVIAARAHDRERVRGISSELLEHIRRGAGLARQLLLFSQRGATHSEVLDLGEVVRNAGDLLRRLLRESVALDVRAGPDSLPVRGDRGQLEQVLMNLALNGADAMAEGGTLTVACGRDDRWIWVEVRDTGHGIPEAIRARIFEPFFTTKGADKGSGLGLAVAHGIVTAHGGRIEVTSATGAGSTFRVTLPIAEEDPATVPEPRGESLESLRGDGRRVLVVEDEPAARAGLAEALEMLGYGVVAVGSAEEAGVLPEEPGFDVLLTDFLLPGASGVDLARGLADRWPGLRMVLMSGYTEDETVREGIRNGTVRFLQKPFTIAAVARELHAALSESRHT